MRMRESTFLSQVRITEQLHIVCDNDNHFQLAFLINQLNIFYRVYVEFQ